MGEIVIKNHVNIFSSQRIVIVMSVLRAKRFQSQNWRTNCKHTHTQVENCIFIL